MNVPEEHVLKTLERVFRDPVRHFVWNWNWKASLFSSTCRGLLFFATNAPAGLESATRAMAIEFLFRAIASGVLGSLTQALRFSRPRIAALLLLPAFGHAAEYIVHFQAGTPRLGASVLGSVGFTVLTTAFNLFAMRRGALIVGPGQGSLVADLSRLPRLMAAFVLAVLPARCRKPPLDNASSI